MVFHVSIWGIGALIGGKSPKSPRGDGLLLHRPDECIRFTPSCPPTFCNKIAPMVGTGVPP